MVFNSRVVPVFMLRLPKISGSSVSKIAAIALLDKTKNIKCHVSKKRKRNMYNFASTIKSFLAASPKFYNIKRSCRDMYCGILL